MTDSNDIVSDQARAVKQRYALHLAAGRVRPRTAEIYRESVVRLGRYLAANDLPTSLSTIKAEHLERYMVWTIEEASPGSAQFHFRSLQQFFRWAVDEGLIDRSPMAKMKRPQVDEVPPPVLTDAQLATLLIACDGRDFESRRDRALIRLLIDTGCRRSEILGLRWQPNEPDNNDVDLAQRTLRARGKGGRWRFLHFGRRPP